MGHAKILVCMITVLSSIKRSGLWSGKAVAEVRFIAAENRVAFGESGDAFLKRGLNLEL